MYSWWLSGAVVTAVSSTCRMCGVYVFALCRCGNGGGKEPFLLLDSSVCVPALT